MGSEWWRKLLMTLAYTLPGDDRGLLPELTLDDLTEPEDRTEASGDG